ncbi:MAG: maltose ABC transporter permease MalF [Acidimicrobiia bacterium]|nr:maltose ABC transporter permease MalF [Acidimicrobiia bacterium]
MTVQEDRAPKKRALSSSSLSWGFWVKIGIIAVIDAMIVFTVPILVANESYLLLAMFIGAGLLLNWAYLSPRAQALPWLAPGLIFMAIFVVFPVIYTGYVSLTNWQTGNVLAKQQVIDQLESQVIRAEGEGVPLELDIYRNPDGELAFLVRDPDGITFFGVARDRTAEPIEDPLIDPGVDVSVESPDAIGDFELLSLRDLLAIASQIENLVLDIPGQGVARAQSASSAQLIQAGQRYTYDAETDVLFDAQEGISCSPEEGNFVCEDGRRIDPGWVIVTGFENYQQVFTNERIRGPFVQVFIWNLVFALGSVFITFAIGLALANALQDERLRGRAIYRSIYILPYAIPAFLSVLIWRGLLNESFGQVNNLLESIGLGAIPWLGDPFWAKVAVLLVNAWLGFPYMFLITSGALTAIPEELKEAARVDGASAWRVFRTITLPLLLVSTAPLLIGSFAFNFNNFVLIFMLTNGGPPVPNAAVPLGETDILISFTFDLAVNAGRGNQFALGSAIVVMIFVIVAVLSAVSFRFTKRLEEVYG